VSNPSPSPATSASKPLSVVIEGLFADITRSSTAHKLAGIAMVVLGTLGVTPVKAENIAMTAAGAAWAALAHLADPAKT